MAIFSLSLQSIGRTTHATGTAGAHIQYISRDGAGASIGAYGIPANANEAQAYLNSQETTKDRINARVVDKLMLALPRELTSAQRYALAEDYAQEVTQGRTGYYFAIHETGKDANNPHCHLVIRDRDIETGEYVLKLSDNATAWKNRGMSGKNPTEYLRERWEYQANKALEQAGHDVRIDRRSLTTQRDEALRKGDMLRAQELDRKAQIHVGVRAQKLAEKGIRPESQGKYSNIDQGKTRPEHNAEIINLNLEKRIRSRDVSIQARALFEKEQAKLDKALQDKNAQTQAQQEKREQETRAHYKTVLQGLGKDRNAYAEKMQKAKEQEGNKARLALEAQHREERHKQQQEQGRFFARMKRLFDFTGKYTAKEKQQREGLLKQQQDASKMLQHRLVKQSEQVRKTAHASHAEKINTAFAERDKALQALEHEKHQTSQQMQEAFQKRAVERYHGKEALEDYLKIQEREAKAQKQAQVKDQAKEQVKTAGQAGETQQKAPREGRASQRERSLTKGLKPRLQEQKQQQDTRLTKGMEKRQTSRVQSPRPQIERPEQQKPAPQLQQSFTQTNQQTTQERAEVQHRTAMKQAQEQDNKRRAEQQESKPKTEFNKTFTQNSEAQQQRQQDRAKEIANQIQQARETPNQEQRRGYEIG